MKVLLVDDHAMVRQGIATALKELDHFEIVGEASNGSEAVKQCKLLSPELIIMDINMPELDGLEASQKIREFNKEVKILILTMLEDENYIFDALSCGINGYIYKMSDLDYLLMAIESIKDGDDFFDQKVTKIIIRGYNKKENPEINLTTREYEVLQLIIEGFTSQEMSEKLFISKFTVQKHRKNILAKLNLHNTAELVKYTIENNLV